MKRNDVAAFFGAIVILLSPVLSFSQTPFYQGKTITVIQSRSPGGLRYKGKDFDVLFTKIHSGKSYYCNGIPTRRRRQEGCESDLSKDAG